MKKSFARLVSLSILTGVSLLLSGCVEGPQPPQTISFSNLKTNKVKEFTLPSKDFQGTMLDTKTILGAISDSAFSSCPYQNKIWPGREVFYKDVISKNISSNAVLGSFISYQCYSRDGHCAAARFDFEIPVEITLNGDVYKIKINEPTHGILHQEASGYELVEPLHKVPAMSSTVFKMYNGIDGIVIHKNYILRGEIISKYSDSSLYGNFKRIVGPYTIEQSKNTDIMKGNTYSLKFKNQTIPLNIEVYPYRNGSKLIYETSLPYSIGSNGGVSLTKKEVEEVKAFIAKVAND